MERTRGVPLQDELLSALAVVDVGQFVNVLNPDHRDVLAVGAACLFRDDRVHVLFANAEDRDSFAAKWVPVFEAMAVEVRVLDADSTEHERRGAYSARICLLEADLAAADLIRDTSYDRDDSLPPWEQICAVLVDADVLLFDQGIHIEFVGPVDSATARACLQMFNFYTVYQGLIAVGELSARQRSGLEQTYALRPIDAGRMTAAVTEPKPQTPRGFASRWLSRAPGPLERHDPGPVLTLLYRWHMHEVERENFAVLRSWLALSRRDPEAFWHDVVQQVAEEAVADLRRDQVRVAIADLVDQNWRGEELVHPLPLDFTFDDVSTFIHSAYAARVARLGVMALSAHVANVASISLWKSWGSYTTALEQVEAEHRRRGLTAGQNSAEYRQAATSIFRRTCHDLYEAIIGYTLQASID